MALFQKKPIAGTSLPLYTFGAEKSLLIIGLGNPGDKYKDTRHNIGFKVLESFAKHNDFPVWTDKKELKCELTMANLGNSRVILAKPTTFMNHSGEAAQAVQHYYRLNNQSTLAVYDELAITFGQLRTRLGGSDAGHNGVKSLIQHLGDDFGRLRIGIGSSVSQKAEAADFVLGKFTGSDNQVLPQVVREANVLITEFIFSGQLPQDTRNVV